MARESIERGITSVVVGGKLVHQVRFMRDGARINLGSYEDKRKAIRAKIDWDYQDALKQAGFVTEDAELLAIVAESVPDYEHMMQLLSEIDPSQLGWHQPATINGVSIPASVVAKFQDDLYK